MENELEFKYLDPEEPIHEGIEKRKWVSKEEALKEFPDRPERLNPEIIDCAWIKWDHLAPPKDVKGLLIRFDNGQTWTDAHFYSSSEEYKNRTIGNAKPIAWTFMERRDPNKKTKQC